jgi:N-acyl-D-amino-acid deacylase
MRKIVALVFIVLLIACNQKEQYDSIIRNGMIYDGNGAEPYKGDIGINADTIAFIGDLSKASAKNEIDAKGKALAPGFIDTHSHHAGNLFQHRDFIAAVSQGITRSSSARMVVLIFRFQNFIRSYPIHVLQ